MARPFITRSLTMLAAASLMAIAPGSSSAATAKSASTSSGKAVIDSKPWSGDFDGMLARRRVRMLVPYSRTLFYVENGQSHGLTADLAHDFETYLNQTHAKELGGRKFTVVLVPTTRDKLLSGLAEGRGDISGGNLTATAARMRTADFVVPTERAPAREVLVSGPNASPVLKLEDLSGRQVNVRQASSYHESLEALNDQLGSSGKTAVRIVAMPDALEDEDVLEMLGAGLFDYTVVDSWKAKLWADTAPGIHANEDIVLRSGGSIAWAIRKQSPKLQAELEGFYKTASQQGLIESRLENYRNRMRELSSGVTGEAASRFQRTLTMFREHGTQYAFDPLMLAAEGFHEGGSASEGAPASPANADDLEKSVQTATKYVDQLMAQSFPDAKFSELDRTLFIFASYKAGPDKIASMRQEAAKRGLDPNQWLNNVELVSAEKLGMETTAYVRNILKYAVASKLVTGATAAK